MYVGVTNDLERRLAQHRLKLIPGFTKKYNLEKLVHYECFGDIKQAILREKEIKAWRREKKDRLVQETNPESQDLSLSWIEDSSHTLGMTTRG